MPCTQGWFESNEEFRQRVAQEADAKTIAKASGAAPTQGWLESSGEYRERISREATEARVGGSTGDKPSQGWFEDDGAYQDRIEREANEATVLDATGRSPSQGPFESNADYRVRIRQEAHEHVITDAAGGHPRQGWFESKHDYRSRIAHEARIHRATGHSFKGNSNQERGVSGSDGCSSGSVSVRCGSSTLYQTGSPRTRNVGAKAVFGLTAYQFLVLLVVDNPIPRFTKIFTSDGWVVFQVVEAIFTLLLGIFLHICGLVLHPLFIFAAMGDGTRLAVYLFFIYAPSYPVLIWAFSRR